jgi:hypothetical protein
LSNYFLKRPRKISLALIFCFGSNLGEREAWMQGQIDKLTDAVKLLNAPKTDEQTPKKQGFFGRLFGNK